MQNTNTCQPVRLPEEFTVVDHAVQDALRAACDLLRERGVGACVTVTLVDGRELSRDNH